MHTNGSRVNGLLPSSVHELFTLHPPSIVSLYNYSFNHMVKICIYGR
jgi:hypothetical protein